MLLLPTYDPVVHMLHYCTPWLKACIRSIYYSVGLTIIKNWIWVATNNHLLDLNWTYNFTESLFHKALNYVFRMAALQQSHCDAWAHLVNVICCNKDVENQMVLFTQVSATLQLGLFCGCLQITNNNMCWCLFKSVSLVRVKVTLVTNIETNSVTNTRMRCR